MTFDRWESYETVGSTMDIARKKTLAGDAAGTVIMAEFQTGGRGRQGRGWFAPPGANVCMTAVGEPVPAAYAWRVALVAGVAAAEGVAIATGLASQVRFPNDIYLNGKKLGGILIETVPNTLGGVTPLIGIGVNINVAPSAFPSELHARATSTLSVTGREFPVGAISGHILRGLGELWDGLGDDRFAAELLPRWRTLAAWESLRTFRIAGEAVRCRVLDVAANGLVTLETEAGEQHAVQAAQVILGED